MRLVMRRIVVARAMIGEMKTRKMLTALVRSVWLVLALAAPAQAESGDGWINLFNGKDLTGWTAKFTGRPLGENFGDTFRVEDGLLKVRYDKYESFDRRFGHLYWREPYSAYHLLIEYRFVGDQVADGPDWAVRNSGVMFHAQTPESMRLEQEFPVSIEAQFLGGLSNGKPRPTANVCTPGTDIEYEGRIYTPHCLNSSSATFDGDQWVQLELIVRGGGRITHRVNGEIVLEYSAPQLSDIDLHLRGSATSNLLSAGFIALQSESHPMDVRKVQLKVLPSPELGWRFPATE